MTAYSVGALTARSTSSISVSPLHAHPVSLWQLSFGEMQLSPHALPSVQVLQQLPVSFRHASQPPAPVTKVTINTHRPIHMGIERTP